jgi:hypothetical protein
MACKTRVLVHQKGLTERLKYLFDPNKFSADGTSRLGAGHLVTNGKYISTECAGRIGLERSLVLDVATRKPLSDHLTGLRMAAVVESEEWIFL